MTTSSTTTATQDVESDAWALLSLRSMPASPSKVPWTPDSNGVPIAKIEGKEFEYLVRQHHISVGK